MISQPIEVDTILSKIKDSDTTGPYLRTVLQVQRELLYHNPDFDQDAECGCGHAYYRHFDGYDDNYPVGCKYCSCCEWHKFSIQVDLMTPSWVLKQTLFDDVSKILPDNCECFDDLLQKRDEIRHLRYLPVKHDDMRAAYKAVKDQQLPRIMSLLGDQKVIYAINEFPYFLPPDVEQGIVWVAPDATEDDVIAFLGRYVNQEVVMFERPLNIDTPMVKGTFPALRHIHVWTRNHAIK